MVMAHIVRTTILLFFYITDLVPPAGAGTIASKDYGVAKKAKVIAVKVLRSNGSGSMSDVVAGVDWAAQ